MKVTINMKEMRDVWTMADVDRAKALQAAMKDDESRPAEYFRYAADAFCRIREHGGMVKEIFSASAEIAGNGRLDWDQNGDGTGRMDVWLSGSFLTLDHFVEMHCYLTDIWGLCWDDLSTYENLLAHSYIREYIRRD